MAGLIQDMSQPATLILIMAVAVLAPLLAYSASRWFPVPLVIFEILSGIVIGPDVLGWAHQDAVIETLSHLGLTMLIFLAGYEIDFVAVGGGTFRRAIAAWSVSIAAGLAIAFVVTGGEMLETFVIGTALTSTAVGTIMPILRDSGLLGDRFGGIVLAFGAVGEFGPIIAMAVLLSGRNPGQSTVLLIAFAVVTVAAIAWALRPRAPWFSRLIAASLHSSGQFAVRYVMLLLAAMLGLTHVFGLDSLLGAFAAGILTRLVLQGAAPQSSRAVLSRIEAIGFGFLVPVFYIVTGINFDLDALLANDRPLMLLPAFLVLFLLVRGLPQYLLAPRDLTAPDRIALLLYGSTCLPLVVAITTIGLHDAVIETGDAAALIGAAMISVLVFPLVAARFRPASGDLTDETRSDGDSEAW